MIKRLNLSNNFLMNDGDRVISNALKENATLTHLSLSQNKLGDKVNVFVIFVDILIPRNILKRC